MHGLDIERVESCRDVTWRAKWNLVLCAILLHLSYHQLNLLVLDTLGCRVLTVAVASWLITSFLRYSAQILRNTPFRGVSLLLTQFWAVLQFCYETCMCKVVFSNRFARRHVYDTSNLRLLLLVLLLQHCFRNSVCFAQYCTRLCIAALFSLCLFLFIASSTWFAVTLRNCPVCHATAFRWFCACGRTGSSCFDWWPSLTWCTTHHGLPCVTLGIAAYIRCVCVHSLLTRCYRRWQLLAYIYGVYNWLYRCWAERQAMQPTTDRRGSGILSVTEQTLPTSDALRSSV